jgi:uncharacterized membrane protein (UPF0127 family)
MRVERVCRIGQIIGVKFLNHFILLLALLLSSGCTKSNTRAVAQPASADAVDPVYGHLLHAQSTLPTIKVWLGSEELITEIARKPVEIATGMMFRTNMPENTAMVFLFPDAAPRSFYMRNCVVPLSAAYIATDGTILEIIDMTPHDETGIPSKADNVQFVLEVPQGWFTNHHIGVGTVIRTEKGSLPETFFQRRQ